MSFKLFFVQLCSILTVCSFAVRAQGTYQENARLYVLKYKDIAMQEQARTGVPAAIKLAQGIYETAAGKSELCAQARNHFGIKCKSGWTGLTYAYTDDAPDECFRSYGTDQHSYTDHSDFLKTNPRYKSLFTIDPSDYKAWARGLKKCGYATNPAYAEKLIQTIETFGLQQYTTEAATLRSDGVYLAYASAADSSKGLASDAEPRALFTQTDEGETLESAPLTQASDARTQDKEAAPLIDYYVTTEKNGIKGFYAKKGDLLLEYALTHRVRYARLLEWNDLPDAPLEANMFIYLSKKRRSGLVPHYTTKRGMTMHLISQEVGISLADLLFYNKMGPNEQPVPGTVLNLQGPVENKPEVYTLRKTERQPVERRGEVENGYIYKKDIDNSVYAAQQGAFSEPGSDVMQMTSNAPAAASGESAGATDEPAVSVAAERLAAAPGETGEGTEAEPDLQELTKKEKRALKKAEKEEKEEEDLSPLEKLKRHMDKNVYGNRDRDWREDELKDENGASLRSEQMTTPEQITTFPARSGADSSPVGKMDQQDKASAATYHTVRSGDTAFGIAKRYGISLKQLREWNNLPGSMVVQIGQRLRVAP